MMGLTTCDTLGLLAWGISQNTIIVVEVLRNLRCLLFFIFFHGCSYFVIIARFWSANLDLSHEALVVVGKYYEGLFTTSYVLEAFGFHANIACVSEACQELSVRVLDV